METWQAMILSALVIVAVPAAADETEQVQHPTGGEDGPCTMADVWTTVPPRVEPHWACILSKP